MSASANSSINITFPTYTTQMYITSNPLVYFFVPAWEFSDARLYGATIAGIILICIFLEFLGFLKWFMITRKRITANSLAALIHINKTASQKKHD